MAGDVLTAGQQLLREPQLLSVLGFQRIEFEDDAYLFLFNRHQTFAVAVIPDRNIFQQRLLFPSQRGQLRFQAG